MAQPVARAAQTSAPNGGRLAALGALIWRDRAALLATAARAGADGQSTLVECTLRGASMSTAIPAGARVRIACGGRAPRIGDVVAFSVGEGIVVHRVVWRRLRARRDPVFITRGDARVVPDAPVAGADLLGQVIAFDAGTGWQPVGARGWKPRRERALALAVLVSSALLLELGVEPARRYIARLDALANRYS